MPILVCWILMLIGEIGKTVWYQIYPYSHDFDRLPLNFCGSMLILVPYYLLSLRYKCQKNFDFAGTCLCVNSFGILFLWVFIPKLLIGSLLPGEFFWENYQNAWGIIDHTLISFIGLWFIFHRVHKLRWVNLVYQQITLLLFIMVMGLTSYYCNLNFGLIAEGVFFGSSQISYTFNGLYILNRRTEYLYFL
jgi:hypothetical protein